MWNRPDRKSTRLNSSHMSISYAVFCLKKKKIDADRILQAAAMIDESTNIHAEIVRMKTHIHYFRGLLDDVVEVGKKLYFFFLNDTANAKIYPLSLHDALPI